VADHSLILALASAPLLYIFYLVWRGVDASVEHALLALLAVTTMVASLVISALSFWGLGALRRAWTRLMLRRDLHARLTAAGLTHDATSPEAQALRAAFWSDAQRDASRALAARHAASTPLVAMLPSIRARMLEARLLLIVLATGWLCGTLCLSAAALLHFGSPLFALLIGAVSIPAFFICIVALFSVTGAVQGVGRLIERQELARDRRHVIALTDLASAAGGLSLADGADEALRGALSRDVVGGGEIELVRRPAGDEDA
jgi:hypothetical protein